MGCFLKYVVQHVFMGKRGVKYAVFGVKKWCLAQFQGAIWRKIGIFVCKSENEVEILSCFVAVEITEKVRRSYGYPMKKVSIS